jgi:hypothetical protein
MRQAVPIPRSFPSCRDAESTNCERKESDQGRVPVRENEKREPVTSALDGDSPSIMYECAQDATPASIVQQAAAHQ